MTKKKNGVDQTTTPGTKHIGDTVTAAGHRVGDSAGGANALAGGRRHGGTVEVPR